MGKSLDEYFHSAQFEYRESDDYSNQIIKQKYSDQLDCTYHSLGTIEEEDEDSNSEKSEIYLKFNKMKSPDDIIRKSTSSGKKPF